jgi:hypothetical protein
MSVSLAKLGLKKPVPPPVHTEAETEFVQETVAQETETAPIEKEKKPKKTPFLNYPRDGLRMQQYKTKPAQLWVVKILEMPLTLKTWPAPKKTADENPKGKGKGEDGKPKDLLWEHVYQVQLYSVQYEAYFFQLAIRLTPEPKDKPDDYRFRQLSKTHEEAVLMVRHFSNGLVMSNLPESKKKIMAYRNRLDPERGFVSDNLVIEWAPKTFTGAESFIYSPELLFGEDSPYMCDRVYQTKFPQLAESRNIDGLVSDEEPVEEDQNQTDPPDNMEDVEQPVDEMEVVADEEQAEGSELVVPEQDDAMEEDAGEAVDQPPQEDDIPWTERAPREEKKVVKLAPKPSAKAAPAVKVTTLFANAVPAKTDPYPTPKKKADAPVILPTG